MGRFVKRGEKGIRILAPTPYTIDRDQERIGADGKPVLDQDGEPMKETVEIRMTAFKPVSTFDISQTEGEPVPSLGVDELKGSVDRYALLFEAMQKASPAPVSFEDIPGAAKGYFNPVQKRIAIQEDMSEVQNVKTLIHEMTHAKLHALDKTNGEVLPPEGGRGREHGIYRVPALRHRYERLQLRIYRGLVRGKGASGTEGVSKHDPAGSIGDHYFR